MFKYAPYFILTMLLFSCGNSIDREQEKYDEETGQQEIYTKEGIDKVLDGFEQLSFDELDDQYKTYADPYGKFDSKLKGYSYYVVKGRDIFKYVVGRARVKDFLPSDGYYKQNEEHLDEDRSQYWLVDKEMLYMVLEFNLKLEELGYDKYGFYVRESHRHPKLNTMRGGASQSQHMYGKAVDMVIEDINKDGKADKLDKDICLEILEGIVGNKGGMGLYPGTQTIHIDSRGYAARWDSY